MTAANHTEYVKRGLVDAECGVCALEGPDRFGRYELVEDSRCPVHGEVRPARKGGSDEY